MYRMLMTLLLVVSAWSLSAQNAPVPEKFTLETPEDCARYDGDVLRCAEWMLSTPYAELSRIDRLQVAGFLIKWVGLTPDVTFDMDARMEPVMKESLELSTLFLAVYLSGGAKYALQCDERPEVKAVSEAGIDAVIAYYEVNRSAIGKVKPIERMIRSERKP